MPRPWGKLHASMLSHRKFIRMTIADRSAWLTLVLSAINSTKDEDLGTRDDVTAILAGFGEKRPGAVVDRLVELTLIDIRTRDGHHLLHDWDDWQPTDPTGAKRKANERARAKVEDEAARNAQSTLDEAVLSDDSHGTVTRQSPDSPETVTRLSSDLSRESRSRDGEERRGEGDSPQPPASGGRSSRANGTSPRALAKAQADQAEAATGAKAWRRNQRNLAYARGAITEAQQVDMNGRDAPLDEISDWVDRLTKLQHEDDPLPAFLGGHERGAP